MVSAENNSESRVFPDGVGTPSMAQDASPSPLGSPPLVDLENWEAVRNSGISPRFINDLTGSERGRTEFLEGARLMGVNTTRKPLRPQQLWIADALNAVSEDGLPLCANYGIHAPRRITKTTSILAVALGRCANPDRPEYRVGLTLATSRDLAAKYFRREVVPSLERLYPDEEDRPFKLRKANGSESITWPDGSVFEVVTPSADGFRSQAYDLIIIDEAGAAPADNDILDGALSTMDTRPEAQLVITGTAAEHRNSQMLWTALQPGREGKRGAGIVDYSAPVEPTAEDYASWDVMREMVAAAHPGVGTLTTWDVVRTRWEQYREKPQKFGREYLGVFGMVGQSDSLFDPEQWMLHAAPGAFPAIPSDAAVAIAVHPLQLAATVMAAWRDRDGKACLLLMENKGGINWVTDYAGALALKRKVPIVYDDRQGGESLIIVERMKRLTPRPMFRAKGYREVRTATALLLNEVETGNVKHWSQKELNEGIRLTVKRMSRGSTLFGRADDGDDITPVEAAALALHAYDSQPVKRPIPRMIAS